MTADSEAWLVAGAVTLPVVIWWCVEMINAWRERRAAQRIMRETRGDGMQ